jgi:hypothetical protein
LRFHRVGEQPGVGKRTVDAGYAQQLHALERFPR